LSILAHEAVALPLSHSFPASELRYLLNNSEARILLVTPNLKNKAEELLQTGLQHKPMLSITKTMERGSTAKDYVNVDGISSGQGGFMLYTSGTTSRPV
jgi:long-subunit acyl-CoA synthetase (AMP-forming)